MEEKNFSFEQEEEEGEEEEQEEEESEEGEELEQIERGMNESFDAEEDGGSVSYLFDKEEEEDEEEEEDKKKMMLKKKKKKSATIVQPAKEDRSGICYLSRVPPFMQPSKLKQLLESFGKVGRTYLVPEKAEIRKKRKKFGGNKRRNFTEGWVEFEDKKIAKQVARSLNATRVAGKKRSKYYDELWNIKYLPKYKWHHLIEKQVFEKRNREKILQVELSKRKKEAEEYRKRVDKSKYAERKKKQEEAKEAKKRKREAKENQLPSEKEDASKRMKLI